MANPFTTAKPALSPTPMSDRQRDYLRDLMLRKAQIKGIPAPEAEAKLAEWLPTVSAAQASTEIDQVKAWLAENKPAAAQVEDGFYRLSDVETPIRVIHAVHGSGHQYARALNADTRKWDVQIPGLLNRVSREGVRIDTDPDLAPALGKLYGICMVCGTTLTDKNPGGSIELGIGPVCRARRGW